MLQVRASALDNGSTIIIFKKELASMLCLSEAAIDTERFHQYPTMYMRYDDDDDEEEEEDNDEEDDEPPGADPATSELQSITTTEVDLPRAAREHPVLYR
jgi:hypothetical protein